jgi:hypothetical protein
MGNAGYRSSFPGSFEGVLDSNHGNEGLRRERRPNAATTDAMVACPCECHKERVTRALALSGRGLRQAMQPTGAVIQGPHPLAEPATG